MQGLMMNPQFTLDKIISVQPPISAQACDDNGAGRRVSPDDVWRDVHSLVKRLAKALVQLGVEPGDHVGTFAWNNYQHLELYYAVPDG